MHLTAIGSPATSELVDVPTVYNFRKRIIFLPYQILGANPQSYVCHSLGHHGVSLIILLISFNILYISIRSWRFRFRSLPALIILYFMSRIQQCLITETVGR
uniref:Uncharacterized protein n=1 Tax=Pararge aegeria TaxID=116150 RepID=S4PXH3_9NEOP